jgi:hypothetical protein
MFAPFDRKGPATQMTILEQARAILTDTHFLTALGVFCVGLALLITLH